ncbi:6-phosphogluconolactonase [Yoonia sp. 208BN28-4]|uniref:6-phosphogluconolactonase n=1 Tax=Yoonia sp. 208BN28-4 TaxID=3126505 RepID=UPI0030984BB4
MDLKTYPDSEMLMIELAQMLAGELENALLTHDRATLAVPGGTTPGPCFDALCAADLDWSRVTVMLTDERRVPVTSERSNERLVRERLLQSRAAAATFLRYLPDDDGALDDMQGRVADHLPIDVLLLGMGTDMHTASIFPNSPDLDAALTTHDPLVAVTPPDDLEPRVSLSMAALKGAMSVHVLIVGNDKKAALEKAQHAKPVDAPVAGILHDAMVHWAEG